MPRPERVFELCQVLAGSRGFTIEELASHFRVSERTIYRDLELLARTAPFVSHEGRYRLMDGATLRPLNLTLEERLLLELALDQPVLRRRPGLARRLRRLEGKLHAAQSAPPAAESPWSFAPLDRTGPAAEAVLETLERAAADHRVCDATYVSLADGRPRPRRLHPLRLFLRADAWYLAAFAPEHGEVRTFRLDRFDEVRPLADRFAPPAFDLDAYLADSWELFRGDGEFEVHLRFDAALGPLLLRGRQHAKESVESCEDGIHYRVDVTHLDELARWVVGFGGKAMVVGPEELRERVLELAVGAVDANERRIGEAPRTRVAARRSAQRRRGSARN